MRKFLLLFVGALTLLSGCSTSEIGERAINQAAAVDYDGEYIVSALLFSSGGGSGELVNAADENVIKVTGRGSTFSEAVDDISLVDGKEIFMSENRLLILGAGFVETDFTPALETLSRDMRCSLNMLVCTADDPEILTDLHFKEGLTAAEKPVSMIENAYSSGSSRWLPIWIKKQVSSPASVINSWMTRSVSSLYTAFKVCRSPSVQPWHQTIALWRMV